MRKSRKDRKKQQARLVLQNKLSQIKKLNTKTRQLKAINQFYDYSLPTNHHGKTLQLNLDPADYLKDPKLLQAESNSGIRSTRVVTIIGNLLLEVKKDPSLTYDPNELLERLKADAE